MNIKCKIEENQNDHIVLGKNALRGFLLDPFKYKKGENPFMILEKRKGVNQVIQKTHEKMLQEIDEALFQIEKQIHTSSWLQPINIAEQKRLFIESQGKHIPQFEYVDRKTDFESLL